MSKYNYAEKDHVAFSFNTIEGYGQIVGVATSEVPILGCYYMVKVLTSNQNLPNDTYPFTTISMPEIGLAKLHLDRRVFKIDDVGTYPVELGVKQICYLKTEYFHAISCMPEPERSYHVKQWAEQLFATGELPSKVTLPHLHQLLRYGTQCK